MASAAGLVATYGIAWLSPVMPWPLSCTAISTWSSVRFTDYDPTPLDFVARSALANGVEPARFSTARLDWRDPPDERFEVILGADLLYENRLVPLVADVLDRMLAPGGVALLAGPFRTAAERFPDALKGRRLRCDASPVSAEGGELGPVRGTLYRVESGRPSR